MANNDLERVQSAFQLLVLLRVSRLLGPLQQTSKVPLERDDVLLESSIHTGLLNVLLDPVVQTLPLVQQDWNIKKMMGLSNNFSLTSHFTALLL